MSILLFLAVQPAISITLPERSLASETLPAIAFDCLLHDDANVPFRFKMDRRGGRAFLLDGKLALSPLVVTVSDDHAGKLTPYTFSGWGASQIQGRAQAPNAPLGSWIDLVWEPASTKLGGKGGALRVALMIREFRAPEYGMRPLYRAVGFCALTTTAQEPLTVDEVRKVRGE